MQLYPLKFQPIYMDKVWGGRRLERLGHDLPGDSSTLIGESWELADLSSTTPSGGGGGPVESVVAEGEFAGQSLRKLIDHFGTEIIGTTTLMPSGRFPLLVKYLDAKENLSIQTHPSPEYAKDHPGAHLKSEAWYIVEAEPGAMIYKGLRADVGPDDPWDP